MKRRQLIKYASTSLLTAFGLSWYSGKNSYQAQTIAPGLQVQWLGHTCFLFTGGGLRVLVNPFLNIGCTAGYTLPKVEADLVLISSQLLDEGSAEALPGNPRTLFQPGVFQFQGREFQGIAIPHDREGGRRFGTNVAWRWTQAGIDILHLGGAAAPIELEQQILMGSPDLALIPVGGKLKAYNAAEAKQAMLTLQPKIVIPTHYLTLAADTNTCELGSVEEFLQLVTDVPIKRNNTDTLVLSRQNLPSNGSVIQVLSDVRALVSLRSPRPAEEGGSFGG